MSKQGILAIVSICIAAIAAIVLGVLLLFNLGQTQTDPGGIGSYQCHLTEN